VLVCAFPPAAAASASPSKALKQHTGPPLTNEDDPFGDVVAIVIEFVAVTGLLRGSGSGSSRGKGGAKMRNNRSVMAGNEPGDRTMV